MHAEEAPRPVFRVAMDGWMGGWTRGRARDARQLSPLVLPVTKMVPVGIEWSIYLQHPEERGSRNPIDDRSKSILAVAGWQASLLRSIRTRVVPKLRGLPSCLGLRARHSSSSARAIEFCSRPRCACLACAGAGLELACRLPGPWSTPCTMAVIFTSLAGSGMSGNVGPRRRRREVVAVGDKVGLMLFRRQILRTQADAT